MNQAILKLRPVKSHVSSLHHLPGHSHQTGASTSSMDVRCALCDAQIDGRTKNKKTCEQCLGLFHVKCLPNHLCPPVHCQPPANNNGEESYTEDMINLSQPPVFPTTTIHPPTCLTSPLSSQQQQPLSSLRPSPPYLSSLPSSLSTTRQISGL